MEQLAGRRNPADLLSAQRASSPALAELLEEVVDSSDRAADVSEALHVLASLDGRRDAASGVAGLPAKERARYGAAEELCAGLPNEVGIAPGGSVWSIGLRCDGRPFLSDALPPEHSVVARRRIAVNDALERRVAVAAGVLTRIEEADDAEAIAHVERLGPEGIAERLAVVYDALVHTAPLILFARGETYTNYGTDPNLAGKEIAPYSERCALAGVIDGTASLEECQVFVCLDLLVRFGGPPWMEAFNGVQLGVSTVRSFAAERLGRYRELRGRRAVSPPAEDDGLARVLHAERAALDTEARDRGIIRHRKIEGIGFRKTEEWTRIPVPPELPERLAVVLDRAYGRRVRTVDDLLVTDRDWVAEATVADRDGLFPTAAEGLLGELLTAAIDDLEADYSMTRGVRDVAAFVSLEREGRLALVEHWDLDAYYCMVMPRADTSGALQTAPTRMVESIVAIAGRMRYNSWHFVPPSTIAEIDVRRDYFFAPLLPDLAEWVDQRHRGHTEQQVKHSIRYPVAVPSVSGEHGGLADLRVCRRSRPFGESDLLISHTYAMAIRGLLAGLFANADVIAPGFTFGAYDEDWSARLVASLAEPEASALSSPGASAVGLRRRDC